MTIKAIETQYKGYRFRSRLEARWAIFFDSLHVEWEYETEGFELPDGVRYLPDFLISNGNYIEIKPSIGITEIDMRKATSFYKNTENNIYIFMGDPYTHFIDNLGFCYVPDGPAPEGNMFRVRDNLFILQILGIITGEERVRFEKITDISNTAAIDARSARFEFGEEGNND